MEDITLSIEHIRSEDIEQSKMRVALIYLSRNQDKEKNSEISVGSSDCRGAGEIKISNSSLVFMAYNT